MTAARRELLIYFLLAASMLAFAFIGSARSDRAHRALDSQYQQCMHRYGFGGEGFPECLRGDR